MSTSDVFSPALRAALTYVTGALFFPPEGARWRFIVASHELAGIDRAFQ